MTITKIHVENGSTTVSNSPDHTPRCLDVSTHLTGRNVESTVRHWPGRDKDHEYGEREAYVSIGIEAEELDYEAPPEERAPQSFARRSTEQTIYMDVEDARELHKKLGEALACADVK